MDEGFHRKTPQLENNPVRLPGTGAARPLLSIWPRKDRREYLLRMSDSPTTLCQLPGPGSNNSNRQSDAIVVMITKSNARVGNHVRIANLSPGGRNVRTQREIEK